MNLLHALVFGIVEGITEFLPISSTGHLILAAKLMGLEQTEFIKSFEIVIQLGAILSVIYIYGKTLCVKLEILKRVLVAFIPTALLGFVLYKFIKHYLLSSEIIVLWSLFIGGIVLIVFELIHREDPNKNEGIETISYKQAVTIGLFQSIAMVPGVSRAAATIVGGLMLGVRRKTIVEFSFLLAVPTMLAATCLDLVKNASSFSLDQSQFLIVGFVSSFFVSLLSIRWLLRFIQKNNFIPFGVYRIVLALGFWYGF